MPSSHALVRNRLPSSAVANPSLLPSSVVAPRVPVLLARARRHHGSHAFHCDVAGATPHCPGSYVRPRGLRGAQVQVWGANMRACCEAQLHVYGGEPGCRCARRSGHSTAFAGASPPVAKAAAEQPAQSCVCAQRGVPDSPAHVYISEGARPGEAAPTALPWRFGDGAHERSFSAVSTNV